MIASSLSASILLVMSWSSMAVLGPPTRRLCLADRKRRRVRAIARRARAKLGERLPMAASMVR
jgi:hypothetical protein